jgi:hypothetical protein
MFRLLIEGAILSAVAIAGSYGVDWLDGRLSALTGQPDILYGPWSWSDPPLRLVERIFLLLFMLGLYVGVLVFLGGWLRRLVRQAFK